MTGDNVYVYGIIESEEIDMEIEGVNGADRATTVDFRNLSAVVSDVDTTDPERTDENVRAHDEVLRRLLEEGGGRTVVPMSFGMAFKNNRALKSVLRGARHAFTKALSDVDGTVELGVKVISETDVEADADAIRERVDELFEPVSVNSTDNGEFSDRLIVNKSYLVEREEREAFDEAVDELEAEFDEQAIIQYTGPWAPYNFVDIHVGAEQ